MTNNEQFNDAAALPTITEAELKRRTDHYVREAYGDTPPEALERTVFKNPDEAKAYLRQHFDDLMRAHFRITP